MKLTVSRHFSTTCIQHIKGKSEFKKLVIPGGNVLSLPRERWQPPERAVPYIPPLVDDLDWRNRWPSASSFNPTVPLQMRQGVVRNSTENKGEIPGPMGNQELMKIPNFLHLTPSHIATQCEAMKIFCTKWPEGLQTTEDVEKHYPVEVTTRDFVRSSKSIRDENARFVKVKIPLKMLEINQKAMDKLKLLVGKERLEGQGEQMCIVLESGRCPTRAQNLDYLRYVFRALLGESQKVHYWEKFKDETDRITFDWEKSSSRVKLMEFMEASNKSKEMSTEDSDSYGQVLSKIVDHGEDLDTLQQYKSCVLKLLKPRRIEVDDTMEGKSDAVGAD